MLDRVSASNGWTVATAEVNGMRLPSWGPREAVSDRFVGSISGRGWLSCLARTGRYVVVGDRDVTKVTCPASEICAAGCGGGRWVGPVTATRSESHTPRGVNAAK